MIKKLLEWIKNLILKGFNQLKLWFFNRAIPWFKKNWLQIINLVVLFLAYSRVYDLKKYPGLEALLGLWIFVLLGYYIFWKLLGFEKVFKKNPPVPPTV